MFKHRAYLDESLDDLSRLLWFITSEGAVCRGKAVYVLDPLESSSLVLQGSQVQDSGFQVIRPSYLEAVGENARAEFLRWITDRCGVATEPRLLRNGSVTKEFNYLSEHAGNDLLTYLRDSSDLLQSSPIKEHLPEVVVTLRGSNAEKRKLLGTALPTDNLLRSCPDIPFVDLPNPNDKA